MATAEELPLPAPPPSLPVLALTVLGSIVAILGFLVGGNVVWTGIGLGTVVAAGIIGLNERLIDTRRRS